MATYKQPHIWNIEPIIAMGINPKTGLPYRLEGADEGHLKENIKQQLRIIDEQTAVNRFTWYNLPVGLTSELMERILYYRGQGMFFYMADEFYFLPYALDGGIDVYGRFKTVTPLPFNGSTDNEEDKPIVDGLTYNVAQHIQLPEDYINEDGTPKVAELKEAVEKSCVLLRDYSPAISQIIQPRATVMDSVLDMMSECLPMMRTALFNSTGILGLRVGTQDEQANAEAANRSVNNAALTGKRYIPVIGDLDFQELAAGNVATAEQFLLSMQGIDNYRLSLYGLDNGGLFQKRSGMLQEEAEMNQGNVGLILRDGLRCRQDFCDIVNSIWGLGIWCEVSEEVIGVDMDGDGMLSTQEDETGGNENDDTLR